MAGPCAEAWAAWSAEERRRALQVRDLELIHLVRESLSALWAAEIQARKVGIRGPAQPFDQARFPLISQMEFDGSVAGDEKVFTLIKWPKDFHEDAEILLGALRQALGRKSRRSVAPLPRRRWQQLLRPLAPAWQDLERQLARLAEQVLLQAIAEERSKSCEAPPEAAEPVEAHQPAGKPSKWQRRRERHRLREAVACASAPSPPTASEVPESQAVSDVEELDEGAIEHGASGDEAEDAEESEAENSEAEVLDPEYKNGRPSADDGFVAEGSGEAEFQEPPARREAEAACCSVLPEPEDSAAPGDQQRIEPEIAADVLDVLRNQVQQLARELRGKPGAGARSAAAATLGTVGASAFPTVLSIALGAEGTVTSPGMAAEDGLGAKPAQASCSSEIRGIGQGRPIDVLLPGVRSQGSSKPKAMGRGRALEPPPGLPPLAGWKSPLAPQGLSEMWTSSWTIPEEDNWPGEVGYGFEGGEEADYEDAFDAPSPAAPGLSLPLPVADPVADLPTASSPLFAASPPGRPLAVGAERSRVASFVPTPSMSWSKTPSPPGTPTLRPGAQPPSRGAGSSGGGRMAWPAAGPIPAYVTVPVAMAQLCPRCGQALVLPPDDDRGLGPGSALLAPLAEVY